MTKKEVPKSANKFSCERSDFTCSKESNYKDIQWHGNIKYELIRTKKCQKMPNNIIVIVVKSTNMHLHFGIIKRIANMKGIMVSSKLKLIHLVNYLIKENMEFKKMIMENYWRSERHEDKNYKHASFGIMERYENSTQYISFLQSQILERLRTWFQN